MTSTSLDLSPTPLAKAGKRPTLNSIASDLGISRATVSNAFNHPHIVAPALLERILSHAQSLGYFGPDPMARAMRGDQIREVAVVFHHDLSYALQDAQSVIFLRGVAAELDRRQLVLQVIPRMGRRDISSAAFQTTADALIVHADIPSDLAQQVQSMHKPVVLVDRVLEGVSSIVIDETQGARAGMEHVLSRRPDRILIISLPVSPAEKPQIHADPFAVQHGSVGGLRLTGYLQAIKAAGYPEAQVQILEMDDHTPEAAGAAALRSFSKLRKRKSIGVASMSDRMALSVLEAFKGSRHDLCALVGFDDIPDAALQGLTTVRQNSFLKGEQAVRIALDQLPSVTLPVEFILRST